MDIVRIGDLQKLEPGQKKVRRKPEDPPAQITARVKSGSYRKAGAFRKKQSSLRKPRAPSSPLGPIQHEHEDPVDEDMGWTVQKSKSHWVPTIKALKLPTGSTKSALETPEKRCRDCHSYIKIENSAFNQGICAFWINKSKGGYKNNMWLTTPNTVKCKHYDPKE